MDIKEQLQILVTLTNQNPDYVLPDKLIYTIKYLALLPQLHPYHHIDALVSLEKNSKNFAFIENRLESITINRATNNLINCYLYNWEIVDRGLTSYAYKCLKKAMNQISAIEWAKINSSISKLPT